MVKVEPQLVKVGARLNSTETISESVWLWGRAARTRAVPRSSGGWRPRGLHNRRTSALY
jgi:hypothetical protein